MLMLEQYLGQAFIWRYDKKNNKSWIPTLLMVGGIAISIVGLICLEDLVAVWMILLFGSLIGSVIWLIVGFVQYQYQFVQEGNALFFVLEQRSGAATGAAVGGLVGAAIGSIIDAASNDAPANGNLLTLTQGNRAIVNQIIQVMNISETNKTFKVTCSCATLKKDGTFSKSRTAKIAVGKDIQNLDSLMARLYVLQG